MTSEFIRAELDQLTRDGKGAGFTVVDLTTEAVVEHVTTMIVREDKTGKLYRTEFLSADERADAVEVRQVPSVSYEPVY